jgi:hypothetical protein
MSQIVYVVTAGEYSDYEIRAMFSTKELAQAYIDKAQALKRTDAEWDIGNLYWADDSPSIQEWTLDSERDAENITEWHCGMLLDDGSVVEGPNQTQTFKSRSGNSFVSQFDVKVPMYKDRPIVRVVSYKSADHALKLAAEQRQKWLRMGGEKP